MTFRWIILKIQSSRPNVTWYISRNNFEFKLAKIPANQDEYPQVEPEEDDRMDEDNEAEGEEEKEEKDNKSEEMKDVRSTEDRTIFVKNLPLEATEEQIKVLFVNAEEIRMLKKNNGASRGKAFIEMNSIENAEKVKQLKGTILSGFWL